MKKPYVLAVVSEHNETERFFRRNNNPNGRQIAYREELSSDTSTNKLVHFDSIDEITRFLVGDFETCCNLYKRVPLGIPETFRTTPHEKQVFHVYEHIRNKCIFDNPPIRLEWNGNSINLLDNS